MSPSPSSPFFLNVLSIFIAHTNADQDLISNGLEVHLQEDPNLELPFLIPEHGYSCDMMRGVPVGLEEYLEPAVHTGEQLLLFNNTYKCTYSICQ